MIRPLNKVVAAVLVLLNLAVTVYPHIGHPEDLICLGDNPVLETHTCGAHEIHKDISDHGFCLLCSRTTHFVAFVVFGQLSSVDRVAFIVVSTRETPCFSDVTSPHFLRGPPALPS